MDIVQIMENTITHQTTIKKPYVIFLEPRIVYK